MGRRETSGVNVAVSISIVEASKLEGWRISSLLSRGDVKGDGGLSMSLSDDVLRAYGVPTSMNWPLLLVLTRLT